MCSPDTWSICGVSDNFKLNRYTKKSNIYSMKSGLRELKSLVEAITLENAILERYWNKVKTNNDTALLAQQGLSSGRSIRHKSTAVNHLNRFVKLTPEQKCVVAQFETDEFHKEKTLLEHDFQCILDEYNIALEAASIVANEIKRNRNNFDKYVTCLLTEARKHAVCDSTLQTAFVRFHKMQLSKLNTLENNLRIDNTRLSQAYKDVNKMLSRVNEIGNPQSPIELQELRIRCQQASEAIAQKHVRCVQLKCRLAKVTQALNTTRLELNNEIKTTELLHQEQLRAFESIQVIRNNLRRARLLGSQDQDSNRNLHLLLTSYRVPETSDYIKMVMDIAQIMKEHVVRERKLKVAQANLLRHKKLWMKVKKS